MGNGSASEGTGHRPTPKFRAPFLQSGARERAGAISSAYLLLWGRRGLVPARFTGLLDGSKSGQPMASYFPLLGSTGTFSLGRRHGES